jgi:hypothetical protein
MSSLAVSFMAGNKDPVSIFRCTGTKNSVTHPRDAIGLYEHFNKKQKLFVPKPGKVNL